MSAELSRPISVAIVGCGQISGLHSQRILRHPEARLAAVYDPSPAAADRLRHEFETSAVRCETFDQLLACGLDLAVVCSPTHLHFEHVRTLRAAGIAVLCEKPLADSRERICQLIDESRTGPLLSVAYQRRTWSTFLTLRRELESGRYGRIRSITSHNPERWQPGITGTWRDDPQRNPGGFVGDAGSHKIDQLFYVTGLRPAELFAHSRRRGSQVEICTSLSAVLVPAQTAVGNSFGSTSENQEVLLSMNFIGDASHYREDFHVHCEYGDLLLRDDTLFVARNNSIEKLLPLEPESDPIAAVIQALKHSAPNFAPAECALPVWDFTQAVLMSAKTGMIQRWD